MDVDDLDELDENANDDDLVCLEVLYDDLGRVNVVGFVRF